MKTLHLWALLMSLASVVIAICMTVQSGTWFNSSVLCFLCFLSAYNAHKYENSR